MPLLFVIFLSFVLLFALSWIRYCEWESHLFAISLEDLDRLETNYVKSEVQCCNMGAELDFEK